MSSGEIEPFQVLSATRVLQIVTWRSMFVFRWTASGAAEDMQQVIDAHQSFLNSAGGRTSVSMSHIKIAKLQLPGDAHRRLIEEHDERIRRLARAHVVVLESTGFVASIIRGIISGMSRLRVRSTFPSLVTGTAAEGFEFLLAQSPARAVQGVTAAQLSQAYRHLELTLPAPQ